MKTLKIIGVIGIGIIVPVSLWVLTVGARTSLFGSSNVSQAATASSQHTYNQAGFEITLPAGWEKVATEAGTLADFKNSRSVIIPGSEDYSPYIEIVSAPAQFPSLSALVNADVSGISQQTINFHSISSTPETVGGQPASLLDYSFSMEGTPRLTNAQLVMVKGGTEYGLTGIALTSNWAQYSGAIEKALLSLQVL